MRDRWYAGRGKIARSSFKSWDFLAFLLIILLFPFQSPCYAADITDQTGTESILSTATGGTDQVNPAIWDDRIVWAGYYPDPDNPEFIDSDIYLYNVTSGDLKKIPTPLLFQDEPAIWEHLVVWHAWEDDNYEIHLYNLFTEDEQRLTNDTVDQIKPRIWGNCIVWEEGEEEVYLYNILTLEKTRLGDVNSSSAKSPAIWEDRVVWEEQRDASLDNLDIFLFNITTGEEMQITTNPFAQTSPSIWGDRIVWLDSRDSSPSLYVKDIRSGQETRIASGNLHCKDPVIYGNFVASVNDKVISLIDLDSMTEKPISTDTTGSSKDNPGIWGDRVVWTDMRNGDFDIFLYTIGTTMPSLDADFTSNVTQGEPPLLVAFSDTSQGQVEGWFWDFGDGTVSSEKNPVHSFDSADSYTVILTVHNPWQRDAEKKTNLISAGSIPVPEFSQNRTSGPAPLAVLFTDKSSGLPTGWEWDFGDGVISDEKDPVHVYALPGVYSVDLAVSNIFGNASVVKTDLITVMNGTNNTCILPSQGINLTSEGGVMRLTLNTSEAGICTVNAPDQKILKCQPFGDSGIAEIQFMAEAGNRFVYEGDDTITGPLGCVTVQSDDLYPNNFTQKVGENSYYNFKVDLDTYVQGGRIQTVAWEGCTPEDSKRFEQVKFRYDYSNISDLAYSVRFELEGIQNTGPASLVFAVSSDWVQEYGWSDDRDLEIATNVSGAMIFIDGTYMGVSPIIITNLTPCEHQLRTSKDGYRDNLSTLIIGSDKRESIHVIRIGDNGSGEVLNTTFIGHDDEQNLDFFMAESPNGLSTFGLASLSRSGNLFRLFTLAVTQYVQGSGGGGGGGGGAGGGYVGGLANTPTTIPTPTPVPTLTLRPPAPTESQGSGSEVTGTPVPTTPPPSEPTQTSTSTQEDSGGWEWPPYLVILRNLSVVFAGIFVAVVFYLRWNKREA